MKHPLVTVKPHDTIRHPREIMETRRMLPVVIDGRLVGVVTDRDLRDAFDQLRGRRTKTADPANIRVEEVMTSGVVTLPPDAPLADTARLMRRQRIGAVPIVARGQLVGILTRSDILEAFLVLSEAPATAVSAS